MKKETNALRGQFDTLAERIIGTLNSSQLGATYQIAALLNALTSLLVSIKCRECRHLIRKHIEDFLPTVLDEAMLWPADEEHLH